MGQFSASDSDPVRGARVVLVDDDEDVQRIARLWLLELGVDVRLAPSGERALEILREGDDADLLITDLLMPAMSGEELLREARALRPSLPVVVMSGQSSVDRAVALLQAGATDYLSKPLAPAEFRGRVGAVLERARLRDEVRALREELDAGLELGPDVVIGSTPAMLAVWRRIRRVARTTAPVVLLGESGTGKEVLARALHVWSPRAAKPLVTVNCGAIPDGLFESEVFGHRRGAFTDARADRVGLVEAAKGGTLFLDEVAELPLGSQVKLLRLLESGEFRRVGDSAVQRADVRVVCATHRDLGALVAAERFREDLYYRLNVVAVTVPPLRDRLADVPELANALLAQAAAQFGVGVQGLAPASVERLTSYRWPGNVRELRNKLQQAAAGATGPLIEPEDLELPDAPPVARGAERPVPAPEAAKLEPFRAARRALLDRFERAYVQRLLEASHGNVSRAATLAGMPRKALVRLIERQQLGGYTAGRRGRPRREA